MSLVNIKSAHPPIPFDTLVTGMVRRAPAPHPPTSRELTPVRGVALVHGGQRPITLQSLTNFLLPPDTSYVYDCGNRNGGGGGGGG